MRLDTKYAEVYFPRSWIAYGWETKNFSGNQYVVMVAPPAILARMFIVIYDEASAGGYLSKYNLTDAPSIVAHELRMFQENANATLQIVQSGTVPLFGYTASYSVFELTGVLDREGNSHNLTGTFMSFMGRGIIEVAHYGSKEEYYQVAQDFESILNLTKIKEGE